MSKDHPLVSYFKNVDIRDKFITALEESLNYCREADDCGSIDHEMSRWQEWVKTWPQIADENGGI